MNHVEVIPVSSDDPGRTVALIRLPDGTAREIFIEANVPVSTDATPWLAAEVPVAMALGADLQIAGAVDRAARANVDAAQKVLNGWYPEMRRAEVETDGVPATLPAATGVACFFSGGVDSFYSALENLDRITHLIFVHGFDIPISNDEIGAKAREGARAAAVALGKPLIEVATDLRAISNYRVDWQTRYHGAAMAAVAHALADVASEFLIPGSFSSEDLHPWGTHPDLDQHWSGSRVAFSHDAVEVPRPDKVRYLGQHQVALDHLRVCFKNPDGAYNCGKCEKCVRTMINLSTAGALQRCKTLPTTLDLDVVRRLHIDSKSADIFVVENLEAMASTPRPEEHAELANALRHARRVGRVRRLVLGTAWWGWRAVLRPIRNRIRGSVAPTS